MAIWQECSRTSPPTPLPREREVRISSTIECYWAEVLVARAGGLGGGTPLGLVREPSGSECASSARSTSGPEGAASAASRRRDADQPRISPHTLTQSASR